jgi:hypothetical protein
MQSAECRVGKRETEQARGPVTTYRRQRPSTASPDSPFPGPTLAILSRWTAAGLRTTSRTFYAVIPQLAALLLPRRLKLRARRCVVFPLTPPERLRGIVHRRSLSPRNPPAMLVSIFHPSYPRVRLKTILAQPRGRGQLRCPGSRRRRSASSPSAIRRPLCFLLRGLFLRSVSSLSSPPL